MSVPVRMFPATESTELRFHFLHRKDLTPIAYEKVRREDRDVDPDEIVRGFEIRKAYYLQPADGAEKPYRLLVRALEETGKVGIAKVVDLMAALRESVERTKKQRKGTSKRKAS